ncbi:vacuolar membrane-associated protein IML1 [Candidozyma auris]|nr:vacuolar membrane-associated protein IML1 [[Candida] auris]
MYNWNQFDQLLAGYDDTISETREFHKMKFVVMPADMSQSAYHVNNDSLSDEEIRVEGLRKLISLIERGRYSQSAEKPTKKKEEILPEISFYTGNLYDFLNEQAEVFLTSGTQPQNSLMVSDSKFNTNIKLQVLAETSGTRRSQLGGPYLALQGPSFVLLGSRTCVLVDRIL